MRGRTRLVETVSISRQGLGVSLVPSFTIRTLRPHCSIKDIWDATGAGFEIFNADGSRSKYKNWQDASVRLKQIANMGEDEFTVECETKWDTDEDIESEGEEDEEEEECV